MAAAKKATVYIEADDEITAVIDKVLSVKESIVAVVLPKRAAVFQSSVNMKLLKRAAEDDKKKIVLISSEPGIELIAAAAGMHIAQSLTSKPVIPKKPKAAAATTITPEEVEGGVAPVAATAAAAAVVASDDASDEPGTAQSENDVIELDNTDDKQPELPPGTLAATGTAAERKKKFKIPDFSNFKLRMAAFIGLAVLLVTGWIFGFVIMPKATVTINTNTSHIAVDTNFVADATAEELNVEKAILPAKKADTKKTDKATVDATGKKNIGEKAAGTLTLVNCRQGAGGVTVAGGTGFTASGKTFVTNEAVELGPAVYVGSNCVSGDYPSFGAAKDVGVTAANAGEDYNIEAQSFSSGISGVSASGSEMSGGTTENVKVISEEDVKKARDQLSGSASAEAIEEMKGELSEQGLQPLVETLVVSEASVKTSKPVGAQADSVTVTQSTAFSMLGVKSSDIGIVLDAAIAEQLKEDDQEGKHVRNNGLSEATYQLINKKSTSVQTLKISTIATVGSELDEEAIAAEVAGKKRGEIEELLETKEGVRSVSVEYSPMWITTTPKSASKIEIVVNEVEN